MSKYLFGWIRKKPWPRTRRKFDKNGNLIVETGYESDGSFEYKKKFRHQFFGKYTHIITESHYEKYRNFKWTIVYRRNLIERTEKETYYDENGKLDRVLKRHFDEDWMITRIDEYSDDEYFGTNYILRDEKGEFLNEVFIAKPNCSYKELREIVDNHRFRKRTKTAIYTDLDDEDIEEND